MLLAQLVSLEQRVLPVWLESEECKVRVEALDQLENQAFKALSDKPASLVLLVSNWAFV